MATQVELAIAWGKKRLGSSAYSGYCQTFVADCYVYGAGYQRITTGTANGARKLWRVSTSRNIPVGACVYFDSPTSPAAGHVGIYIGNNQVIHAFGKVKIMTVNAIIGAGYAYQGWGWYAGKKPTGAGEVPAGDESYSGVPEDAVIHIPQTEKVWTVYEPDKPDKPVDRYQYTWQSMDTKKALDISDRVGSPDLEDDSDSLCVKFTFAVLQSYNEQFLPAIPIQPGDYIWITNTGSGEAIYQGQVQSMSGSFRDSMQCTCLDSGRLLTLNEIIMQFNNCAAKVALSNIANKVGIQTIICPDLVSSVYDIVKDNAASVAQKILETVTAENGVHYFLRILGDVLVVRSYAKDCITGYCRQEDNLAAFDILDEASAPNGSWSIEDLRNHVLVYSEVDNSVSVLAEAENAESIQRYGRRTALETFSDQNQVTAAAKAKSVLAEKNQAEEEFSLHCFGSDRIVAGCRLRVDLAEFSGEFWVTSVTHHLGPPHTMDLNLRRAD